jgi:hypothetical protein
MEDSKQHIRITAGNQTIQTVRNEADGDEKNEKKKKNFFFQVDQTDFSRV